MDVSFCMFMSVDIINKYSHTNSTLQGCSKWVSRGIRDRYFFVGIIDRAAWDIARDNDRAAGPVRILHGIMTRPHWQARLDTARDTYCK